MSMAQQARKAKIQNTNSAPPLMSGEGIAMLTIAAMFDLIPPILVIPLDFLFGIGELISWPLDMLATVLLGGWMWARGGKMPFKKKAGNFAKKRLIFFAIEYIPGIGSVVPSHIINVYRFLKK